ncbi:hypothetical protein [Serratia oryzae]|uniref:Uncharacterized protein n=1 Tax=Serratia oryzae TaxID=2034155 RepID=A0A1S8CEG8_9GAMM|nr:hypothetical protein [Serratia oryzae]OMQ20227.1 hypothetical protein BMI79_18765 [Serratia oryzae]
MSDKVKIIGTDFMFEGTPVILGEPKLEEGEFSTDPSWWRVKKVSDKYVFSCLSGRLQGGEMTTEITKEEYDQLVCGELTADAVCLKYNIG